MHMFQIKFSPYLSCRITEVLRSIINPNLLLLLFAFLLLVFSKSLVARRATYVVDGRFFGHFFWKVEGTVRTHVNSRVAHVWLPYTVINVCGRGGGVANIGKIGKFRKLHFLIKVVGSISSHIGSHVW